MKKTRAAAAAIIGLALSATGVLAAAPHLQALARPAPVSTVAQDETAVAGSNDNHGGAVSAVARGTHGASTTHGTSTTNGASATHGKSTGKSQAGTHPASH